MCTIKWYAYLIGRSSEVVCRCLDLLVDGLGRDFLRLLWRAFDVVVDRLGGRLEWIRDFRFNGVEALDRVVVCESEISLGPRVGVDRR